MRTCVILNPEAGRGMSADVIRGALASVPEAEVRVCPKPEAVDFMVRAALRDGFRRIAAAGGDEVAKSCTEGGVADAAELAKRGDLQFAPCLGRGIDIVEH